MTAAAPPQLPASPRGIEVEPGRIEKALAEFWRGSGAAATRASLINLAIYSEQPGAIDRNAELAAALTREHACRSILIEARPGPGKPAVRSWINAHCHIGKAGGKQVCCEQVVFEITGEAERLVPNLLFAHLDSDLPLYFWWQDGFENGLDPQIIKWADRLIYDSAGWADPAARFRELLRAGARLRSRGALCDLNWTRSLPVRRALAHVFDHPIPARAATEIREVTVSHSPGHALCGKLLLAWIAGQLGWTQPPQDQPGLRYTDASGQPVKARLEPADGPPVSGVVIEAGRVEIRVWTDGARSPIRCAMCVDGVCSIAEQMPAGDQDTASLLRAELAAGGRHQAYPRLLEAVAAGL